MKSQLTGRFSRTNKERKALFRSLISNLVKHGQLETTEPKAKAIKGLVDKSITQAKKGDIEARRRLLAFLREGEVVNKLMDEITPRFGSRSSGFTKTTKLGRRVGDGAMVVKMEFVEFSEAPVAKPVLQSKSRSKTKKVVEKTKTKVKRTSVKKTETKSRSKTKEK